MRHRNSKIKSRLGKQKGHRELMLRNMMTSLFTHGKVKTTETRAKIVQSSAEKLITKIKRKDLMNAIREVKKVLFTNESSKRAIEIAKNFENRTSGYTRLTFVGIRDGDATRMALLEFVDEKK
jgi:large subunit ribosomal protein L17